MDTLVLWTLWNNWTPVMINGAHVYCGGTAGYFSVEQLVTSVWNIYMYGVKNLVRQSNLVPWHQTTINFGIKQP